MKKKVIILGGGVAGMSAAHELIIRGFDVEIYERQKDYVGGKARSVNVPDTNHLDPDKYLPGEHGFRFFPGFYKHIVDTMRRTPQSIENDQYSDLSCFENLEDAEKIMIAKYEGPPIVFPTNFFGSWANIKMLYDLIKNRDEYFGLEKGEYSFFAKKILQLSCSSHQRRDEEYEKESWWEYTNADAKSEAYQKLLVIGVTRTLVAADAKLASTKTDGNIILQLIYDFIDPTVRADRLFNAPTNEAWLTPWYNYLVHKGVKYHKNALATSINLDSGKKISSVEIFDQETKNSNVVTGDYYILAVPADRASTLISSEMREVDPDLIKIDELVKDMSWMTGMQFYLNSEVKINSGHVNYAYSEWALTSVDQMSFWKNYDLSNRFNGKIKSILSVDISNWLDEEDNYPAASKENIFEIKNRVWSQLEKSLNRNGQKIIDESMIEHYYLDSDIMLYPLRPAKPHENKEKMLVNTKNSWQNRPESITKISNFYLASDYVRTNTDLATMEAANEAARRAVNGILKDSASDEEDCKIWKLKEPLLYAPLKWYDRRRFKRGLEFSFRFPIWLFLFMVVWVIIYLFFKLLGIMMFKLLGLKPR
ncbi:MAG: NAD(P)-binding protein [Saprospiraceae bacterium]|nr:NAD(P)-binding protein [Saprospiraceae bacterium]